MITQLPRHSRPQLLEISRVKRCVNDPDFWSAFPEFASVHDLKTRLESHKNGGCDSCTKHRNVRAVYEAFMSVLEHMDVLVLERLQAYLGIESLIFIRCGKPVVA